MAYRIAGIDGHKRMLAVVIVDVSVEGNTRFSAGKWEPARVNCADLLTGWSPNKSRKWSWNRPRNIGDP